MFRNCSGRRIKQVKPVIGEKTFVERDAEQTVFDLGFNINMTGDVDRIRLGVPNFDVAGAFDIEHPPIRRHY